MGYYDVLIHITPSMNHEKFSDAKSLSERQDLKAADKLHLALKIDVCKSCKDLIDCLKGKQILDCEVLKTNQHHPKSKKVTTNKEI